MKTQAIRMANGTNGWSKWGMALLLGIAVVALPVLPACSPPVPTNVLKDANGNVIDLKTIDPILNDSSLTQDEKRQQLLKLGVPESVADGLLRSVAK